MEAKLTELKNRLLEINDLESAAALLSWDQTTYMPPGGAVARGRQMATLGQLAHEKFTDPAIGRLLDDLQPYAESLPYEADAAGLLRVTRHDYERAVAGIASGEDDLPITRNFSLNPAHFRPYRPVGRNRRNHFTNRFSVKMSPDSPPVNQQFFRPGLGTGHIHF